MIKFHSDNSINFYLFDNSNKAIKVVTWRKQLKNFSTLFSYANCNTGDIGVTDASAYIVLTYSAKV